MSVTSERAVRSTVALFARTGVYSGRVVTPLNSSALDNSVELPRFYCVHSISGAAGTDFLDLAARLESKIRFFGIQAPPKLMPNIEFGKTVEGLAQCYADALIEFQPKGVLFIGGYCIGAVIALEMAEILQAKGREVGCLMAIDGVPENTPFALGRWTRRYWLEFLQNAYMWAVHPRLITDRTMLSVLQSLWHNTIAIGKGLLGMNRAHRFSGGYSIDGILDASRFPPTQLAFIHRLFNSIFEYRAVPYKGDVVVYEAAVKPPLRLPQIGRIWRKLAPQAEIVGIVGTHYHMMREPYVGALASDLIKRISESSGP